MSRENVCSCGHHIREHKDYPNDEQLLTSAPSTKKCSKCSCTSFHSIPVKIETSEPKKPVLTEKKEIGELLETLETLKISKTDYDNDEIIQLLVPKDQNVKYEIKNYRKITSDEPKKIPIDDLKGKVSEDVLKGLTTFLSKNSAKPSLMEFQHDAIDAILADKHTIISSPTGTGKTEAFIIPIIEKILHPKGSLPTGKDGRESTHALLVYPRTALVDDQANRINEILVTFNLQDNITVGRLHTGIQGEARKKMIEERHKIFACTFDFINWHLITQDDIWEQLIKPAKILVMDESHSYTSYHGSNVHHLLKRMKYAGMNLQYIGSSATLSKPAKFFKTMFDLQEIREDEIGLIENSEQRKRNLHEFFIMPQFPLAFTKRIIIEIVKEWKSKETDKKHQIIVFSDTQDNAERLAVQVKDDSKGEVTIQPHHAAIKNRRDIERSFKAGDIDVLSCTPTLELGIDIGSVDMVITAFTNAHNKFVQRIGRAGRQGQSAYGISVFNPNEPSSNYYSNHIDEYLAQPHEVDIQTDNPRIIELHKEAEPPQRGGKADFHNCDRIARNFPFTDTNESVTFRVGGAEISSRPIPVGFYKLHSDAIFMNGLKHYRVESLKEENVKGELKWFADLIESPGDKHKKTMYSEKKIVEELPPTKESNAQFGFHDPDTGGFLKNRYTIKECRIEIHHEIYGYDEGVEGDDMSRMVSHTLKNPHKWNSKHLAVRIIFPDLPDLGTHPKLHTIIHLLDNASKIITKADSDDIQDVVVENQSGVFYLYDNTANGQNGYSKLIFKHFKQILEKAKELVNECDCEFDEGCVKCTYTTSRCKTYNKELDKEGAKEFFNKLELS